MAGVPPEALAPYGKYIAKLEEPFLRALADRPQGKLVLVTAINPTPAGEGKTTTTIGLGDALNYIGKRAVIALREPSLGPVFGRKGGATGGGRAQVLPMEAINLHFTGDFHAITSAHNLLAALLENHIYWGNKLDIDLRSITWRRVLDMNDRALRKIVTGLGDGANGLPREAGFDITVASEVMAVLCLARDHHDLEVRLARIIVARTRGGAPVTAGNLEASGAMAVLLKDAILPNLVQTIDGSPALIHGGPFANIAHGCNSVIATRAALGLADYVVTEAGFGADLGAEKFLDIKCRQANLAPSAVVLVATVRALKMNGGQRKDDLSTENLEALRSGLANLGRHIGNLKSFGLPVIVAINAFTSDTRAELNLLSDACKEQYGVDCILCRHWAEGAPGAAKLAHAVVKLCDHNVDPSATFNHLYTDDLTLVQKIEAISLKIYHAVGVAFSAKAARDLARFQAEGFGHLPVCMAKTPYSFSADESLLGAPTGHTIPVLEVRLAAGAGFVVAICGDVMTMPGLPRQPAAHRIHLDEAGMIEGLS